MRQCGTWRLHVSGKEETVRYGRVGQQRQVPGSGGVPSSTWRPPGLVSRDGSQVTSVICR